MRINVSFKVKSFDHMDEVMHQIHSLAGKSPAASGFCFATDERDLDFTFRSERKGKGFMRRIKAVRGVRAQIV